MRHKIALVAKRELASYFDSPVAYIVISAFLLVAGWMFFSTLFLIGRADMRSFFAPSPFSPSMLLVVLVPAITMKLVAEERRAGTFELLTTLPVRDSEIIIGKFLAAWALVSIALATTLIYAFTVWSLGDLDWGPVIGGYLGLSLFSASLLAIGLLCSALTDKQVIAFIVSFLAGSALYFVYWLQFFVPQSLAGFLEYISLSYHLDNLARGVIDSRDVLFYVTLTAGTLVLTERAVARHHA